MLLLARHTGHLLKDSASLLQTGEGGEAQLTGLGVNVVHGGRVLKTASKVSHGGDLIQADRSFLHSATTSLLCILHGKHCDSKVKKQSNKPRHKHDGQLKRKGKSEVKERIDDNVAHGILDMGAQILSAATNILTDIAFIKIKILQGLFSNPDCWVSPKNDNNGCISKLCNDTEQRPKIYIDNFGDCSGQGRKWIIDVNPGTEIFTLFMINYLKSNKTKHAWSKLLIIRRTWRQTELSWTPLTVL